MKQKFFLTLLFFIFFPVQCLAVDLGDLSSIADAAKAALPVNKDNILQYLDWENLNSSLTADMITKTDTQGNLSTVNAKIFKKGVDSLRIDMKEGTLSTQGQSTANLGNFYMIKHLIKKKSYLVFPARKAYLEPDPEQTKEIMEQLSGELKQNMEKNRENTKSIEKLGTEMIEGYLCDKAHIIMQLQNGITNDITVWLARQFNNFPLKTIVHSTTPQGMTGTNTTIFKNIKRAVPDEGLFTIPSDFTKYDNMVQLVTGGKYSGDKMQDLKSRIKKRRGR